MPKGRPTNKHTILIDDMSVASPYYQQQNLCSNTCSCMVNALNDKVATAMPDPVTMWMEFNGVWTGPVSAARALRSLAPAFAAPVVPPYTAWAGAYVR